MEKAEQWMARAMRVMPVEMASMIGAQLGRREVLNAAKAAQPWVQRFYRNVEVLCGASSPSQQHELLVEFGRQAGRVYAEYTVLQKIDRRGLIEVVGRQHLQERSRPTLFITPHLANWELVCKVLASLDNPTCALYEPRESPARMAIARQSRLAWGDSIRFVSTDSPMAMRTLDAALARGHNLLVLPDEEKDGYVSSPALGRDLPYVGNRWMLSRLAVKHGVDIVPMRVERLASVRSRVTINRRLEPLPVGSAKQKARHLADQIDSTFEHWVRDCPQHWYWLPNLDLSKPHPRQHPTRQSRPNGAAD